MTMDIHKIVNEANRLWDVLYDRPINSDEKVVVAMFCVFLAAKNDGLDNDEIFSGMAEVVRTFDGTQLQ